MTPLGVANAARPEAVVVVGTHADAMSLAPLTSAVLAAGQVRPIVVVTGAHPMLIHEALDEIGSPPDVTLLVDRPTQTAAEELGVLLPRLDRLVDERGPSAVLVRGGSPAALAAAQVAFLRGIPVVHVEAAESSGMPGTTMVAKLATASTCGPDPRAVERVLAGICAPQEEPSSLAASAIA